MNSDFIVHENPEYSKVRFELFKELYPFYLSLLSSQDEQGRPNVNFQLAAKWALEASQYGIKLFTGGIDEQEGVTEAEAADRTKESPEAQASQSQETGQVAS